MSEIPSKSSRIPNEIDKLSSPQRDPSDVITSTSTKLSSAASASDMTNVPGYEHIPGPEYHCLLLSCLTEFEASISSDGSGKLTPTLRTSINNLFFTSFFVKKPKPLTTKFLQILHESPSKRSTGILKPKDATVILEVLKSMMTSHQLVPKGIEEFGSNCKHLKTAVFHFQNAVSLQKSRIDSLSKDLDKCQQQQNMSKRQELEARLSVANSSIADLRTEKDAQLTALNSSKMRVGNLEAWKKTAKKTSGWPWQGGARTSECNRI